MIFLETSFIINLYVPKIRFHERAKEIEKEIENREKIISPMIIYETLTVLRKLNQTDKLVRKVYKILLNLNVFEDELYYPEALKDCLNNNKIGFFDNLSHIVMMNSDIKEIASFDEDFDIFNDIERIC
ncbi:MAG: PIN domain-containing protein [Methanobrevibacter sp.]|jgi:predicted nucleic acid-binding protein|nr:PIN domain-containing protein [Methanobrevibacter sp.]